MKAWRVNDRQDYTYSTVVFAETRGLAKSAAKATKFGEGLDWTDIRVTRLPELDGEYRGHFEMDWEDKQDRRALAKVGFGCADIDPDECENCVGKLDCWAYKKYIEYIERILGTE